MGARFTRGIAVRVLEEKHGERALTALREIVRAYPGPCELQIVLGLADGTRVQLKSGKMSVEVNAEMRQRIDELLGPGNLKMLAGPSGGKGKRPAGGRQAESAGRR